ncbi:zinc-dependent alcohol dehydrogenase family protein [Salinisphaera sp. T31B1]|uniref:zinc-dependent alcohol dehydrogenase family protein n=1 Tax=Salinisphaera sp. T31B1 TaxID=727963 RepID=UPI0033420C01
MKKLEFSKFGRPKDALSLVDGPSRGPEAGEVRLRVEAAPINPADLLLISGEYGYRPELPATPGLEGVGRVVEKGEAVSHLKLDDVVLLPLGHGSWAQEVTVDATGLFALPDDVDPLQLAMLAVNPLTASALLSDITKLAADDWVLLNAANSAVGQYVLEIASRRNLRTVAIVRRGGGLIMRLKERGATEVIVDRGQNLAADILAVTGGLSTPLALDAVGGPATAALAGALSDGGQLVNYGAMAGAPCDVPAQDLVFRGIDVRGFWLTRWIAQVGPERVRQRIEELADMLREGRLRADVYGTYDLSHYKAAFKALQDSARTGKILFTPGIAEH